MGEKNDFKFMNSLKNISGKDIEIIRSFDGRNLTTVLFDFDGTLSRERDGWVNLMVAAVRSP